MNQTTAKLPFSESCERNKQAIFDALKSMLDTSRCLLEIGSGTGQHAVWMAKQLPDIRWQPSETPQYLGTLQLRLYAEAPDNVLPPLTIDVADYPWLPEHLTDNSPDAVLTSNTLHIMSTQHVEAFWKHAGLLLKPAARVFVYGPFKYNGDFTTPSNANFDDWLKQRDPLSGVRDFEWINLLADNHGFDCIADHAMPANNQFIVWQKRAN